MIKNKHLFLLLSIIVIEGYIVLSTELLAIRQTIPFVGSGTDTVSIIIAAVLMPLAFGYYAGGKFKPGLRKNGRYTTIRKKLLFNILIASGILLLGMSYPFLSIFFMALIEHVSSNRLILVAIYSGIFLIIPIYLLGQTIPLVSNYFPSKKLAEITGKMLFFSTIGSFLGAVFSTLVLMSTIGVHNTVALNFVLMSILVLLLSKKKLSMVVLSSFVITLLALTMNSNSMMRDLNIIENNQYNTISVQETDNGKTRLLFLNNNHSSKYTDSGGKFRYIEFIEEQILNELWGANDPKKILVIGAGGFTLGHRDLDNTYDYVDIDTSLKRISETYLLKEKLKDNKTFHPMPARAFLAFSREMYDVIILDAYLGDFNTPEHLLTQEFFAQVKKHIRPEGIVVANFIASPTFQSTFSRRIDNTFRSVFPHVSRLAIGDKYRLWDNNDQHVSNIMYFYRHRFETDNTIYTDNKNTVYFDKPHSKQPLN